MASVEAPCTPADTGCQPSTSGVKTSKTVAPNDVHILLVDDERLSRVVVGNLLRKCSYKVTEAGSGMEALEILRGQPPGTFSLVLTDVMMPDVDGIELLKHVRGDEAWSNLPVIMMSANERTETVFECIRGGAEDYLLKPVTKKEVQHMWQHVWRRQQQNALRVPHMCPEDAEDFLRAHSTTASVPSAPLSVLQASAEALETNLDQKQPGQFGTNSGEQAMEPEGDLQRDQSEGSSLPTPGLSQVQETEEQDRERRQSGSQASASAATAPGRPGAAAGGALRGSGSRGIPPLSAAARRGDPPAAAPPTLVSYFGRRGSTLRPADSFRIFCGVLSLLKTLHARGVTLRRVRPSMLRITSSGVAVSSTAVPNPEEESKYASPEELLSGGANVSPKSDVYSLGVLFFELFNPVSDDVERSRALQALRHRILPPHVLQTRPQEAAFVLSLLHPDPECRPSVDAIVRSELLLALHKSIRQRKHSSGATQADSQKQEGERRAQAGRAAHRADAAAHSAAQADQILVDFLRLMRQAKEAEGEECVDRLGALDADIRMVTQQLARVTNNNVPLLPDGLQRAMLCNNRSETGGSGGSRKRKSCDLENCVTEIGTRGRSTALMEPASGPLEQPGNIGKVLGESWQRVSSAFPALESAFFARREALAAGRLPDPSTANTAAPSSARRLVELGIGGGNTPGSGLLCGDQPDHLAAFTRDLSKFVRYSKLKVKATLQYGDMLHTADMLCSISFDRDDEYFATAGVSRRIKVYATSDVLEANSAVHCPRLEMASRSKLSCVSWNSYIKHLLLAADYDGCLALWDAEANACTATFEEHAKRVWSADFSQSDPTRFVSGSDDGTVRLWSIREEAPTAVIDAKANVCSVQFSPSCANLLAFGSANYRVYLYDLRQMRVPLAVIGGHSKAVSYVRWLDGTHLVSASTDNQLKLWDLAAAGRHMRQQEWRPRTVLTGHTNERNFVGLSVTPDGYIACGSEDNSVYAYTATLPTPLARHCFSSSEGCADSEGEELAVDSHQFVSSVCWSRKGHTLLAANSQGTLKLLELD
ncbi:g4625 [Coccomyxa elongata]